MDMRRATTERRVAAAADEMLEPEALRMTELAVLLTMGVTLPDERLVLAACWVVEDSPPVNSICWLVAACAGWLLAAVVCGVCTVPPVAERFCCVEVSVPLLVAVRCEVPCVCGVAAVNAWLAAFVACLKFCCAFCTPCCHMAVNAAGDAPAN